MQGTAKDLASYMARVKILAAKEGVKTYGATSKLIVDAHKAGISAEKCVIALVVREDHIANQYAALPRKSDTPFSDRMTPPPGGFKDYFAKYVKTAAE